MKTVQIVMHQFEGRILSFPKYLVLPRILYFLFFSSCSEPPLAEHSIAAISVTGKKSLSSPMSDCIDRFCYIYGLTELLYYSC